MSAEKLNQNTTRVRESIEWSIAYAYNATDTESPRVLLVGDSICNSYQESVRKQVGKIMNVSFWATSKCVTDRDFFKELDFQLTAYSYDVITFNNGLHGVTSNRSEWEKAYRNALDFIRERCPKAKILVVTNTPSKNEEFTQKIVALNTLTLKIAKEKQIPVVDLFELLQSLDREKYWCDDVHLKTEAVEMITDLLVKNIREISGITSLDGKLNQHGTETGPNGRLD